MMKLKQVALVTSIGMLMSVNALSYADVGLTSLSDDEMAKETGQALFNMSYIAPGDSKNQMGSSSNVGFYKLGLEAEMELNANIKNLQLGCGGINGSGACDIDIKNLSLSGLPDGGSYNNLGVATANGGYDSNGNPVFLNGRPATSAKLTNPFMEFAIKNPDTASTREVLGFRVSAEKISGLLTAGLLNGLVPTTDDGIQTLSGFMRIAATTGDVTTTEATFGKKANEQIKGLLNALGNDREFTSDPGSSDTQGITVPSMNVGFSMPSFQVNGNRRTQAVVNHVTTSIGSIPLANGPNNQLKVDFDPILLIASKAKVALKAGSQIKNLNMDITFNQALSMIHNIPLTGTGGYLSLQQQAIMWPGAYKDASDAGKTDLSQMTKSDVAQKGWWMSFAEPVQLGYLKASNPVNISAVFPQVATLMTNELLKEENRVQVPAGSALGSLFGITLTTPDPIVVDLNAATLANPATLSLGNIQLKNQEVRPTCYGGLTFC